MFGPEDHVPGPDLQDGRRLQGRGDGEQGELRRAAGGVAAAALLIALTVEELETTLNIQRLGGKYKQVLYLTDKLCVREFLQRSTECSFRPPCRAPSTLFILQANVESNTTSVDCQQTGSTGVSDWKPPSYAASGHMTPRARLKT